MRPVALVGFVLALQRPGDPSPPWALRREDVVRFRTAAELPLDAIGEVVSALPMQEWIAVAQAKFRR
jgi:hypothetical protein